MKRDDEEFRLWARHEEANRLLVALPPKQAMAVVMRFGLDGGPEHIGDHIDRSRERARQLVAQGLRGMRRNRGWMTFELDLIDDPAVRRLRSALFGDPLDRAEARERIIHALRRSAKHPAPRSVRPPLATPSTWVVEMWRYKCTRCPNARLNAGEACPCGGVASDWFLRERIVVQRDTVEAA